MTPSPLGTSPQVLRSFALITLLVAGSACDGPIRDRDVSGIYVAEDWGAQVWADALPDDGYEYQVAADTLVLARDGTGTRSTVTRKRSKATGDTTFTSHRLLFNYRRSGDRILTLATGCEGDCSRGPLLPSFYIEEDALYPTTFGLLPFLLVADVLPNP